MKEKVSYILGLVTVVGIVGITAYSILEYKKLLKQSEGIITVDQAIRSVEELENKEIEERYVDGEISGHREDMVEMGVDEYENPQEFTEEDKTLRHDKNSGEARDQFIAMNLAEWSPNSPDYGTLLYLYTFPFNPINKGDKLLRTNLVNERIDFFGEGSIWNERVTYADVVLHFARQTEFNVGRNVNFWVELFLENMGIHHLMPSSQVDEILDDLNKHYFFNEDTNGFGIFGLDSDGLDDAYATADAQADTDLTYELLFNEFLKRI